MIAVRSEDVSRLNLVADQSAFGDWKLLRNQDRAERNAVRESILDDTFASPWLHRGDSPTVVAGPYVNVEMPYPGDWQESLNQVIERLGNVQAVRVVTSPLGTDWETYYHFKELLSPLNVLPPQYNYDGQYPPPPPPGEEREIVPGSIVIELTTGARDGWQVFEDIAQAVKVHGVVGAEPIFALRMQTSMPAPFLSYDPPLPDDPLFNIVGYSWWLHHDLFNGVNAYQAWQFTYGYSSVKVAVLDTGIELNHVDLDITQGQNFADDQAASNYAPNTTTGEFENHATPVAGIIAARADNGHHTTGVAPNVTVVPLRIVKFDIDGNLLTYSNWIANAINYAATAGCRVTNLSATIGIPATSITTAYESTRSTHKMVHVASSGNDNDSSIGYPANLSSVIAVGATDSSGGRWEDNANLGSNYGTGLALVAPGAGIYVLDRNAPDGDNSTGDWNFVNGTSFAAPMVAASAALLISYNPELTAAQVETALTSTARDLGVSGYDTEFGYGIVDAAAALHSVSPGVWISSGAVDTGGGWKWQSKFGYLNDGNFPWYFHDEHGWQYLYPGATPQAFWLWDTAIELTWYTSIHGGGIYPFIEIGSNVFYYLEASSNPRYFYDYQISQWITEQQLSAMY